MGFGSGVKSWNLGGFNPLPSRRRVILALLIGSQYAAHFPQTLTPKLNKPLNYTLNFEAVYTFLSPGPPTTFVARLVAIALTDTPMSPNVCSRQRAPIRLCAEWTRGQLE
jgi:hypothetical protein